MKTSTALVIAFFILGGALLYTNKSSSVSGNSAGETIAKVEEANIQNVTVENGKQIVEIRAKGGYTPRVSVAKAGMPTVLRFDTNGTFDCSASVRIPSMNISQLLPNSGSKDIDLGSPKVATLQGTCGMGMYPFEVKFQ